MLAGLGLALLLIFTTRENERYLRTQVTYDIPKVTLVNQFGQPVALRPYLECDKPLLLEFTYTSCTTLCADQSVKFSNLQRRLAAKVNSARLVSISIDPETDRPEKLRTFLKEFQALPGWDFLTGTTEDIHLVMQAFNISSANMVNLDSSLLVRAPSSGQWTRIDGRLDVHDFWQEYALLVDK